MARTEKDYQYWNEKKQWLNLQNGAKNIQVGEIWRYHIGINVGRELSKKGNFIRP